MIPLFLTRSCCMIPLEVGTPSTTYKCLTLAFLFLNLSFLTTNNNIQTPDTKHHLWYESCQDRSHSTWGYPGIKQQVTSQNTQNMYIADGCSTLRCLSLLSSNVRPLEVDLRNTVMLWKGATSLSHKELPPFHNIELDLGNSSERTASVLSLTTRGGTH